MPTIDKMILSAIIDQHGLDSILHVMARICLEKSRMDFEQTQYWEAQAGNLADFVRQVTQTAKDFK